MFERVSNTWELMRGSWNVLRQDKELLLFPVFSFIGSILVLAAFAVPMLVGGFLEPPPPDAETTRQVVYYAVLFLFFFCNYFIVIFFNAAIIACACVRMAGGNPTVADGFRAAMNRIHLIAAWAAVAATVGLILRIIEDRSERVGQIVAGLLGMAWSVVSFFVVPILVIERKGPFEALSDSTRLLRRTWGEQLVAHFSFGWIFFLLGIPAVLLVFLGFASGSGVVLAVCAGVAVLYGIVLALTEATLQAIFQAALYLYARDGAAPRGWDAGTLGGALGRG